jgi:hypothetical protein
MLGTFPYLISQHIYPRTGGAVYTNRLEATFRSEEFSPVNMGCSVDVTEWTQNVLCCPEPYWSNLLAFLGQAVGGSASP